MEAIFLIVITTIALSLVLFKILGLFSKKRKSSFYQRVPVAYLEKYTLN
jgi:hypothetical protein